MRRLQIIEIAGAPYERGRKHGQQASESIRQNVKTYWQLVEHHSGKSPETISRETQAFGPILEAHAPSLLEEMRGIADGAGCDLLDILLVNARSELMVQPDECTALAVAPEVTESGHVLLAQNWDWFTCVQPEPLLLRIHQAEKPEITTLVEAGQVGKIGMNSAGLGVCLNFLGHADRGSGLPVHVLLRQMLDCASLGAAIREAYRSPRGGAANVLLAHREGEILDLELTATDIDFVYGDTGWIVHANHFESPRLRRDDTGVCTSTSTLARAARARRLLGLAAKEKSVTGETVQSILADHAYGAYAICRHKAPGEPALEQTATRASVLMDLSGQTMYVAVGQPCSEEYQALVLPKH
jgi:isopenicillin-N N-acyltransferase-like protein